MTRLILPCLLISIVACAAPACRGVADGPLSDIPFPPAAAPPAPPSPPRPDGSIPPALTAAPVVKPDWIDKRSDFESRRYSQGASDGALVFKVEDAGKAMRWLWPLPERIDAPARRTLVLGYRAQGIPTTTGPGYETVLWLRDGRPWGGFFNAVVPGNLIADGAPHELTIDLAAFKPLGPLTEVCIEVRNAGDGPAVFEITRLDFAAPPRPAFVDVLDGTPFKARVDWAQGGPVSTDFSHAAEPGMALFEIRDPKSHMKWELTFGEPVDSKEFPVLEFECKATGLVDDGYEYLVWLFDNRPYHSAGFEAIIPREIRADGLPHKFYVRLDRFNVAGPLTGCAVRVFSGSPSPAPARLTITKLRFLPSWPAASPPPIEPPSIGSPDRS
jgi:hypothetical protein